ncbi:dienelactone hydrolase family protein [Streptomyces triticirhizae]|uniref:Dienelactone hydrolase domain-containing protein n=1 Tax=Streptomyces triticirhizae TaxID=2483353 RepID=A0A3M2LFQ8_9ACTN|nr:dienelactone hydrolase family protein [Streptomyces triticirhizae]RMI36244.1 hypothetical protein EBN88_22045 [Streptomyces triticirhizae]
MIHAGVRPGAPPETAPEPRAPEGGLTPLGGGAAPGGVTLGWRTVSGDAADPPLRVLVASPRARAPLGRVIVAHHRDGLDDFTGSVCRTLAEAGFLAEVPDLFSRATDPELTPAERKATLRDETLVRDLTRCHAAADRDAGGLRTGVVGHCMGGRVALLAAVDTAFCAAAVSFYGGRLFQPWGPGRSPGERVDRVRCPVLAVGGRADSQPSPADLERLALLAAGAPHPVRVALAEGAGHAFMNFLRADRYHPLATQTGYAVATAFLTEHLASTHAPDPRGPSPTTTPTALPEA